MTLRPFVPLAAVALAAVAVFLTIPGGCDAATYGVDLVYKDNATVKSAEGVSEILFNYTVAHTGQALSQSVEMQLSNVTALNDISYSIVTRNGVSAGSYNPNRPFEFLLERDETARMVIIVNRPPFPPAGTYWMEVEAWPKKDPALRDGHDFAVLVEQYADCSLDIVNPPPSRVFEATSPGEVTIEYVVHNTGNGDDRCLVMGTSSRDSEGWVIYFKKGVDDRGFTPNLTPLSGQPHHVELSVPIPSGVRAGTACVINVSVTSMFNPSVTDHALATIRVLLDRGLNVTYDVPEGYTYKGEDAVVGLKVTNEGNDWDTFGISAEVGHPPFNPLTVTIEPDELVLDMGRSGFVNITVDVPYGAEEGEHALFTLVSSILDESNHLATTVALDVEAPYGVDLSSPGTRMATVPGGEVVYTFVLENTGHFEDTYDLIISELPPAWSYGFDPAVAGLQPGEQTVTNLTVTVSPSYDEAPMGQYLITIGAGSRASVEMAAQPVHLEIQQLFRIEWMDGGVPLTTPDEPVAPLDALDGLEINPYEASRISISVDLWNRGNDLDNVTLSTSTTDQSIEVELEGKHQHIDTMKIEEIVVWINVSKDTDPGTHQMYLKASSMGEGTVERQVGVNITVVRLDAALPPTPTFVDPDDGPSVAPTVVVRPDQEVVLRLQVSNEGTIPLTDVVVQGWERLGEGGGGIAISVFTTSIPVIGAGESYTFGLDGDAGGPPIVWSSNKSGVHLLTYQVVLAHQWDEGNDNSTIWVVVNEPVGTELDLEGFTVTEGDPITVTGNASDDLGSVEWVKVRIDDGPWTVANGTTRWSVTFEGLDLGPGNHTLEVMAYDGVEESEALATTFVVEDRPKRDEPPGFGLALTMASMAVMLAILVVLRRRR